jgi:hypothetical protein
MSATSNDERSDEQLLRDELLKSTPVIKNVVDPESAERRRLRLEREDDLLRKDRERYYREAAAVTQQQERLKEEAFTNKVGGRNKLLRNSDSVIFKSGLCNYCSEKVQYPDLGMTLDENMMQNPLYNPHAERLHYHEGEAYDDGIIANPANGNYTQKHLCVPTPDILQKQIIGLKKSLDEFKVFVENRYRTWPMK